MFKLENALLILLVAFNILNQLVFSNFKTRVLKDIKYILQIIMLLMAGYVFAKFLSGSKNMELWSQILIYIISFFGYGYMVYNQIKVIKLFIQIMNLNLS